MEYQGFLIKGDGTYGYLKVAPLGKGSVPMELRGSWTNSTFAKESIDTYLKSKEVKSNASTKPTSRGK